MLIAGLLLLASPIIIMVIGFLNSKIPNFYPVDMTLSGFELVKAISNALLPQGYLNALITCVIAWTTLSLMLSIIRFIVSWIPFVSIGKS